MTGRDKQTFNREVQSNFEAYCEKRDNGDEEFADCSDETLTDLAVADAESSYDDYQDMKYEESREANLDG